MNKRTLTPYGKAMEKLAALKASHDRLVEILGYLVDGWTHDGNVLLRDIEHAQAALEAAKELA